MKTMLIAATIPAGALIIVVAGLWIWYRHIYSSNTFLTKTLKRHFIFNTYRNPNVKSLKSISSGYFDSQSPGPDTREGIFWSISIVASVYLRSNHFDNWTLTILVFLLRIIFNPPLKTIYATAHWQNKFIWSDNRTNKLLQKFKLGAKKIRHKVTENLCQVKSHYWKICETH